MESVYLGKMDTTAPSLNREETHLSGDIIKMAEKTNISSQECFSAVESDHMANESNHSLLEQDTGLRSSEHNAIFKSSVDKFHNTGNQISEEDEFSMDDFDNLEALEKIELENKNTAMQEKEDATAEEMTASNVMESLGEIMESQAGKIEANEKLVESHMDSLAQFREVFKDTVTINAGSTDSPEKMIEALQTGNYQNIAETKDQNPAHRMRFDWDKNELVVPKESPLAALGGMKTTIQGRELTIRVETKEERAEFEQNWEGFKLALSRSVGIKDDKKTENNDEPRNKQTPGATHIRNGGTISIREKEELSVKLQQQVADAAKRNNLLIMKHAQEGYANTETKRRAEVIKEGDLKKEIDKKLVDKQNLNFALVKEISLESSVRLTSFTVAEPNRANNNYTAKIVILGDHRRKVA